MNMEDRPPTVVFGLDGAHFELLEPWIEDGELPNVERAIGSGVSGDLESVLPPVTSPNWKSYLTGKNPGKLGIYWWENVDVDARKVYYPEDRKNRETEFWEIVSEDEKAGVMGVPTTHPPKRAGEFVVSGAPDADPRSYTYPRDLQDQLEEEYGYQATVESELRATPDEAAEEILEVMDARFEAAAELFEEHDLDFLQVTTFYINSLHHYFWDNDYTLRGWKVIDRHLGRFLDEEWDVVLMSDHGSNEIETVFHVNTWLEREGYLELDADAAKLLHSLGVNRDRVLRVLSPLGLQGFAKRHAPQFVKDMVPDEQGELARESKTSNVDWGGTMALASGQGPLYLNLEAGSEEYEKTREDLMESLTEIQTPDGEEVVAAVYRGEEVYSGPYVDDAPDLVLEQARGVHIQGGIGRDEVFTEPEDGGWQGENKREGLFVATGPSFREGDVEDLSILDLAPTLLHLRGHEVPREMDGEVRGDVYATGTKAAEEEPLYSESSRREQEKRRIRRVVRAVDFS